MLIALRDIVIPESRRERGTDIRGIRELTEDIAVNGVTRELTVFAMGGEYLLLDGEKRLRAASMAGFTHVPCDVRNYAVPRPELPGEKGGRACVIRDRRLLVNTVRRAVETVRRGGIAVGLEQEESADGTVIKIRLPK